MILFFASIKEVGRKLVISLWRLHDRTYSTSSHLVCQLWKVNSLYKQIRFHIFSVVLLFYLCQHSLNHDKCLALLKVVMSSVIASWVHFICKNQRLNLPYFHMPLK